MRKDKLTKIVAVLTVITGLITVIRLGFNFLLPMYLSYKLNKDVNNASTIGIIGGADGPTTIFIASQPSFNLAIGIFSLLTIAGIIYLFIVNRSMK